MNNRKLGKSGIEVAPLAFGGNVFGWTVDDATAFKLLDAFTAAGFNLIDTADVYSRWAPGNSGGESETLLGKWLKQSGKRDKVVVATKVGMEMAPGKKGLSRSYIIRSAEESLKRLQTDYIDLYQSHQDDLETPIEETLEAFGELAKQGKARAFGASNFNAPRLFQSLQISRERHLPEYCCLQPHYNLYERAEYEQELEPLCRAEGIAVISYFSLARGFLSGKYRSEDDLGKSPRGAGVKKYLNDRGFRILNALDSIGQRLDTTPTRIALAWLIARPGITAPIVSATSLAQLEDVMAAARLELDAQALDLLNKTSAY